MKHKCDGCKYKGEHQEMMFKPMGVCHREHNLIEAEKAYNAEKCPFTVNRFGEWISVDERLPEKNTMVLCYFKYEPDSPNVICENIYHGGRLWMSEGSKVTHWMPLPEPPMMKGADDERK